MTMVAHTCTGIIDVQVTPLHMVLYV